MEAGYGGSEKENQIPTLPALLSLVNLVDVRPTRKATTLHARDVIQAAALRRRSHSSQGPKRWHRIRLCVVQPQARTVRVLVGCLDRLSV